MSEELEVAEPIQRPEQPQFVTQTRFDEFDLPPEVLAGLADAGFAYCTAIQAEVLPISLSGRDVAGQAQTGTGKTAAFLLTVFARLLSIPDRDPGLPSALIVAPTRELALQIYGDAKILGGHTGLTLAQVVGGIDYQKQADTLRQGADIVICTPGRIIDYLKQGIFKTAGIQVVVIDEADRLFDLGFTRDMRYILRKLPHYTKRLSMLFSATLSYRILALTYDFMNLPEFIAVSPEATTVEGVEQSLFHVGSEEKLRLLLGLLQREPWTRILIFVNTKAGVHWLSEKLKGNGLPAEGITGDLPQRTRLRLMGKFKEGRLKILVATDVASRGIHVEDISHVFNYDLPQDAESYAHRIGRTARAGKTGRAISFASEFDVLHLEPIEDLLGYKIPVTWPEDDWFVEDKAGPVRALQRERGKGPAPAKGRREPRREHRREPDREARRGSEREQQKEPPKRRDGRRTALSSRPGGIFGLAPQRPEPQDATSADPEKKGRKKKRGRRRRSSKPKEAPKEG